MKLLFVTIFFLSVIRCPPSSEEMDEEFEEVDERVSYSFCKELNEEDWNEMVANFRHMKKLGEGSFGEVRGNHSMVLKFLDLEQDFESEMEFLNKELRAMAYFQNKVDIIQFGSDKCFIPYKMNKAKIFIVLHRYQ